MKSNPNQKQGQIKRTKRPALNAISRNIGNNIKALREAHGLSQGDVADILGISYQQVQKYETGKNRIPMESLLILKDYYEVTYDYFLQPRPRLNEKPKKRDIELTNFIHDRIKTVPNKKTREKIVKIVDVLCS